MDRIPTRVQLAHSSHDKVFVCCFEEEEFLSHLFFGCIVSKKVWEKIFIWFDMEEVG